MAEFLRVINPYKDMLADMPPAEEMAYSFSYELDSFQKHAVAAIHREENVLVTAKTASGKSTVGEYQIAYSLRKGGRVFYTTPIKSLSNQKFNDLKAMFPSVGIVTGDIKFNPDAAVVVMTTECLRNLLYKKGTSTEALGLTAGMSLTGLDAVVFDEVHYINNKERGKVWEETMILLPPEVKLVMLSATIDGAENFAAWIGSLKQRPINLIPTSHRVVPLRHCVLDGFDKDPLVIMDASEIFNDKVYDAWLSRRKRICDSYKAHKDRVAERRLGDYEDPVVKMAAGERPQSYTAELNATARYLYQRDLLPALFFVFSRGACEKFAHLIEGSYIDPSDSASVKHIIGFHLARHKDILAGHKQYYDLVSLLERGIAYHHSGLLPILKEIVELLFAKGLVRVMFCTETFAVGINMPTRTVVFMDLKKPDDGNGHRILQRDEYTQMAGRAGRRGKDKEGLVIYLPQRDPVSTMDMRLMLTGRSNVLRSRMDFHYDLLLKSLQASTVVSGLNWWSVAEKSYFWKQHMSTLEEQRKHLRLAEQKERTLYEQLTGSATSTPGKQGSVVKVPNAFEQMGEKLRLVSLTKKAVNAELKKARQELEVWKNKHMGPFWLDYEKTYISWDNAKVAVQKEKDLLKELDDFGAEVYKGIRFLETAGFLQEVRPGGERDISAGNLTLKGVLATEINEGNPLLFVDAYERGIYKDLSVEDICVVLAGFIKEKGAGGDEVPQMLSSVRIPAAAKNGLEMIERIRDELVAAEGKEGIVAPTGFWELNLFWLEIVADWIEGRPAAAICSDYGIYEGNLYRALMSLSNLTTELNSVATFCGDTNLLEKLKGVGVSLLRDIAINDSLFLRT